jgi:hypothetical protein
MNYTYGHTYKRGQEMTESQIQQAGAEQEELEAEAALIGSRVVCQWGKWRTYATITRVSKTGAIYAKRWNEKRREFTSERKIHPWKGIYATEDYN